MKYCLYNPLNNVLKELEPSELKKLGYDVKNLHKLKNKKIKELKMYLVSPDIDTKTKKVFMERVVIEDEMWKSINRLKGYEDFEGYKVSNYGRVMNKNNKLLMPNITRYGGNVLQVGLVDKNSKRVFVTVGKLVALAFVDKPKNKKFCVHIDDKYNNHYSNIKWCSRTEMMKSVSSKARMITNNKPILKLDKNTLEILDEYRNSYDVERKEKYITASSIRTAIRNGSLSYGYRWCRKKDYIDILNQEYNVAINRTKEIKEMIKKGKKYLRKGDCYE